MSDKKDLKDFLNDKFKELLEKLHQAQSKLLEKDTKNGRLEKLLEEARNNFDEAMDALTEKKNLLKELIAQKNFLKKWKISVFKSWFPIKFNHLISMPIIYGMIIPIIIFHISLEIYHQLAFRLYRIPRVKIKDYFFYDRLSLPYLNWWEKFNCFYCSYFNDLVRYTMEIAGRTERYWCPIKYAKKLKYPHSHYSKFVGYLDAQSFREQWQGLRDFSDVIEAEKQKEQIA